MTLGVAPSVQIRGQQVSEKKAEMRTCFWILDWATFHKFYISSHSEAMEAYIARKEETDAAQMPVRLTHNLMSSAPVMDVTEEVR